MKTTNEIIDCGGIYEVHPAAGGGWAVVNGETGEVRCEFSGQAEPVAEAKRLNATTTTTNLVRIGEWGYGDHRGAGNWYAKPEDAANVQAAYDAMDSHDLGPDCDAEIIAAGGIFVRD